MPKFLQDIRAPFVEGFVEVINASNAVWINLEVNNVINFSPYILGFFLILSYPYLVSFNTKIIFVSFSN